MSGKSLELFSQQHLQPSTEFQFTSLQDRTMTQYVHCKTMVTNVGHQVLIREIHITMTTKWTQQCRYYLQGQIDATRIMT